MNVGVIIDISWCFRWLVANVIIVVIFVDIGKVVDIVYMSSLRVECKKMEKKMVK